MHCSIRPGEIMHKRDSNKEHLKVIKGDVSIIILSVYDIFWKNIRKENAFSLSCLHWADGKILKEIFTFSFLL